MVSRRKKAANLYFTDEEHLLLHRLATRKARDGEDPRKVRSATVSEALRLMWESLPAAERRALEKIDMPADESA